MDTARGYTRRAFGTWCGYPSDYRRMCGIIFVAGVGIGFVDILVPLYGDALGVSNLTIGLLFAAFSLPKAVIAPVVGVLSDVVGHRRDLIAVGFVLSGLLYVFVPLTGLITAFLVIRVLLGGLEAGTRPLAKTLISDVGGEAGRGGAFGLYSSLRTFGTVLGPVVAGVVVAAGGFTTAFGLTGLAFAASGALTFLLVDPDFGPAPEGLTLREASARLRRSVARTRSLPRPSAFFVALYASVFLRYVGLHAYVHFLPLYLETVVAVGLVGVLFSLRTVSAAVCFPLGGAASDRLGRLPILAVGAAISAAAPLVLFWNATLPALVGGLLLTGIGRALFLPTLPAYLSDVSPAASRGSHLGGVGAVSSLAVGVAPLAAGAIGDALSIRYILLFGGVTLAVATAFLLGVGVLAPPE